MSEFFITKQDLTEALAFYEIADEGYAAGIEGARAAIEADAGLRERFREIYETLYCRGRKAQNDLWLVQGTERDPFLGFPPFATNLALLAGYKTHDTQMKKRKIDAKQRERQLFRVRQQLTMGGYAPVSSVPVIWGSYFSNLYLVELGRLQFDFHNIDGNLTENAVGLHIPPEGRLISEEVDKALDEAMDYVPKIYGHAPDAFVCHSWLLSPQVRALCREGSNMAQFYDRFAVTELERSCTDDVKDYLFHTGVNTPIAELSEKTSLQRAVKAYLLAGGDLMLGEGRIDLPLHRK